MSDALEERVSNLKEQFDKCQTDKKEEIEVCHKRVDNLKKEIKEEQDKMEARLAKTIEDVVTEQRRAQKKYNAILISVGGSLILGLLGTVSFFLLNFYNQVNQLINKIP